MDGTRQATLRPLGSRDKDEALAIKLETQAAETAFPAKGAG